jgi:hypothetical protein
METKRIILISITIIAVIIIGSIIFLNMGAPYKNTIKCKNDCIADGWDEGQCEWPRMMSEVEWKNYIAKYNLNESNFEGIIFPEEVENRGPCVEAFLWAKSAHCGNEGQCNCYCFNYKEGALE